MSAYYRSVLLASAVCLKHCMTVTSVLYRSAVGRSAISYCNSDIVIKIGGRQAASGNKLYGLSTADLSITDLSTADLSTLYLVFVDRRPAYRLPVFIFLAICLMPTCPGYVFRRIWTDSEELLTEKSFFILSFVFLSESVIRQVQTNWCCWNFV